jgi:Selenocysteine lyase
MAAYRKYDTCFFERYAQLCLTELLGGSFAGLVNSDRPDLQSPGDTHEVGIEVTRAMEQSKDAARHLLKEMAGVVATSEDLHNLEDLEQIINSGYGYGLDNGDYIGVKEYEYWSMALPLERILKSKVAKVTGGFYGDFQRFGLYVFCKDNLSDFDVLKTLRYVRSLQRGCQRHYNTLFLSEISTLHICRLDDGIPKEERIISLDIDPELRRRLFLESIKY